ncbi:PRC-barrel domain-containing protein [Desulfosporosinus sp. OT]|uniref:PRC-barrel domain-containing protein n=1 Tax=Desulfosporosinus sp. OT TaxID=913865 RepID=UPI000223AFAF|nr:PRC-barrel domain-containing protein [Desulfosporosinus sp. OT]EGW36141.1 PRC-barrel domain protein [Desulfosporosinus sp. OT]
MKPTREIIGLRIISISDGIQVGVVKDLVLNPQGKTLDFIIIDQPTDYLGAKVIAFKDVLGLGEFAITIPHPGVIQDVAQNIEAQNLLKQDTRVLGTQVLTKKGQLIGEVKEVLIDEETGLIAACLFESDDETHEVGAEQIITLGKELLIVEGASSHPTNDVMEFSLQDPIQTPVAIDLIEETESAREIELVTELDFVVEPETTQEPEPVGERETGFNLFEQRQLQYFIDKVVEKDIVLDNGEILRAGERITSNVVNQIMTRSTLMEVTSHLQKN